MGLVLAPMQRLGRGLEQLHPVLEHSQAVPALVRLQRLVHAPPQALWLHPGRGLKQLLLALEHSQAALAPVLLRRLSQALPQAPHPHPGGG